MKLITAIVNGKDVNNVCKALTKSGFAFTKIATTGGFLKSNNITLIMGVDDDKVDAALEIMHENCMQRKVPLPAGTSFDGWSTEPAYITEVLVGGATVFITDVVRFEKF